MAHGPDTEELLQRIAECDNYLSLRGLNITSLPELPTGLKVLICSYTPLTSLPELPAGLRELWCSHTSLTSLPDLPASLQLLSCCYTQLTKLPDLPASLQELWCSHTLLTSLPDLPASLQLLSCSHTSLILKLKPDETIKDYNLRWREWREEQASKERIQAKHRLLKEEIVMEAWHPRKVEKWIEAGVELEDM